MADVSSLINLGSQKSPPTTEVIGHINDSERDRKLNWIGRLTGCVEILLLVVVWGFC